MVIQNLIIRNLISNLKLKLEVIQSFPYDALKNLFIKLKLKLEVIKTPNYIGLTNWRANFV